MKADVTEQGVLIPKEMLDKDIKQVEIRVESGRIVVIPIEATDPIFNLGKSPVDTAMKDAAARHDGYLYEKWPGIGPVRASVGVVVVR